MNLHLKRSDTCRRIGVFVGVSSCESVPGVSTWGKEEQSFHTEISQAAQFIQLSCVLPKMGESVGVVQKSASSSHPFIN